jgi:2-C-methyl-D-erythritol 4-phosphate cytidylyltransferase
MTERGPVRGYTAAVLAGRRSADDPLADAAGAPHRALLDIHGTPMLERVLRTLVATPCIGEIVVSIDTPRLLEEFPGISELIADDDSRIVVVEATDSPSKSVLEIIDDGSPEQPVLVTTADHALLDVPMIETFLARAEARGGDVAVALVPSKVIRERFPEAKRTYLRFADERYSGANLFAFLTPRAREAVRFWTRAESFRKRPWRLVATFGLRALVLFLRRRLDLEKAFEEISGSVGIRVHPVVMDRAEAAVDVDKLSDLALVREILAQPDPNPEGQEEDADQSADSPSATKPPLPAS